MGAIEVLRRKPDWPLPSAALSACSKTPAAFHREVRDETDPVIAEAIGEGLRARLDDVVHVALPDRMLSLLRALGPPRTEEPARPSDRDDATKPEP